MNQTTETLAANAISSMHYFYLRFATGTKLTPIVTSELRTYLDMLLVEKDSISENVKKKMRNEILEGGYFSGMTREQINGLLVRANLEITGETRPDIVQFYMRLLTLKEVPVWV